MTKVKRKKKKLIEKPFEERIDEELQEEGIELFGNDNVDDDYLQLPTDITETPSNHLGRYFNAFTQQKMYVRGVIGRLNALIKGKKSTLDRVKAEVYASLPPRISVKEKEIAFVADDRASKTHEEVIFYSEKMNMAITYLESLEDAITLISREISRRESDWEQSSREDNLTKKRKF